MLSIFSDIIQSGVDIDTQFQTILKWLKERNIKELIGVGPNWVKWHKGFHSTEVKIRTS